MKIILVNPGLNVNLATYEPQGRPIRSRFLGRFQISIYLNFGKMTLVSFCLKTREFKRFGTNSLKVTLIWKFIYPKPIQSSVLFVWRGNAALTVNIVYLRTSQRKIWESAASVASIVRSTYITGAQKGGRSKREVCPFQKAITRMMIMLKQTNNFRTRRVDGSDVDIISNKLTLLYCPYSSATALISAFFRNLDVF